MYTLLRVRALFTLFLVATLSPLYAYFEPTRTDWEGVMRPLEVLEWRLIYTRGKDLNRTKDDSIDLILLMEHQNKDLAVRSFQVEVSYTDRETGGFLGSQNYTFHFNGALAKSKKRTVTLRLFQAENQRLFERLRLANANTVNISLKILELKDKKNKNFPLGVL